MSFGFGKFQIMCFSGKRVRLKNQFGIKQIPLIREHVMIIWDLHLKLVNTMIIFYFSVMG